MTEYAELHAHSAFSFLDGASQPEELAYEAVRLGLSALALTDHDGLYGVVRFAQAAREVGLSTIFGAELHLPDPDGVLDPPTGPPDPRATHLLVLARGPDGYRTLSRTIAEAHLATGTKGAARYRLDELAAAADGQWLILTGCRKGAVRHALERRVRRDPAAPLDRSAARTELDRLAALFGAGNVAVEITDTGDPWDSDRNDALAELAVATHLPLVATGNVHYATPADAVLHGLLFERFLAPERDGPPDIDVDIEAGRREEVIQYVYSRFGRRHAAQVANVISYRPRSAVRDAARALGYDVGQQDAWSKSIERWGSLRGPEKSSPWWTVQRAGPVGPLLLSEDGRDVVPAQRPPAASDLGEIPDAVLDLADRFLRLPRHLGIHSGGMVMCDRPVIEVCPVEWARMPGRTVLQWDKEDCADAGLVKFDLLGLGMLTALQVAFELVGEHEGVQLGLHSLPQEDPGVYDLLCAADTVGVFQVESRAQMATLPRLQPRCFYDIVIEVALIRPGPIQGGSVHPYINRVRGREPVTYLHPLLEKSLAKTKGVPLFQEQLMQMAIDVAGFTGAEADQLRRAMGSKRSMAKMEALLARLMSGMAERGVTPPVAEQIYDKLKAFADFGFPESHAFSFAYLVYASAWLKVHHPAAFYAGLLAAQPMGFYSPQSLVADARRHGVTVLRPDVQASGAKAGLERVPDGVGPASGGAAGTEVARLVQVDP